MHHPECCLGLLLFHFSLDVLHAQVFLSGSFARLMPEAVELVLCRHHTILSHTLSPSLRYRSFVNYSLNCTPPSPITIICYYYYCLVSLSVVIIIIIIIIIVFSIVIIIIVIMCFSPTKTGTPRSNKRLRFTPHPPPPKKSLYMYWNGI